MENAMNTAEATVVPCTCYTYNCHVWRVGFSHDPCGWCSDCQRADAARAACPVHPVKPLDAIIAKMIRAGRKEAA